MKPRFKLWFIPLLVVGMMGAGGWVLHIRPTLTIVEAVCPTIWYSWAWDHDFAALRYIAALFIPAAYWLGKEFGR